MNSTTSPFAGFTCWTPQTVAEVVRGDAANPSNAVFLATHHPSKILRRPIGATAGGVSVSEGEVLAAFLETRSDLLIMPVIGQPGTGKSHLIRWLKASLPADSARRLIYVPKDGTSLRRVIELILEQMEGNDASALREALNRSADRFNEREAPTALLDALARTLEFRSAQRPGPNSETAPDRKWIAAQLPILLRDAVFRAHLLRADGVIQGFVDKALRGSRPTDRGDAFAFSVEDIPISLPNLMRANKDAQQVHSDLSSDPELQALGAQMLTEQLGPAVSDVFGLSGASSLSSIMRRTRQALAEADKELLILIEDFSVLQGIQRELLDALIAPSVIEGVRVLCPIRVAMAVTSGPFAEMEGTITSRAGFSSDVFVLDLPYGEDGWGRDSVKSFVGRYLNAARLGKEPIEGAVRANRGTPNACESCIHRLRCHDSFGTSDEGYGLYPFNLDALDRCVRSTVKGHFDPRAILGNVVRFTLDENKGAIQQGSFPTPAFDAKFQAGGGALKPLPIQVRDELSGEADGDRYITLLTYWANSPDEVVALNPGIHEAFRLPARQGAREHRSTVDGPHVETSEAAASSQDLPRVIREHLEGLERWAAGTAEIPQGLTNNLRSYLFDSIWVRLEPGDHFFHPGKRDLVRAVFNQYSIRIEGSPTRREAYAAMRVELTRDAQTAAMFRGIVLARHHGHWRFTGGDRQYRLLSNRVEAWSAAVLQSIDEWRYSETAGPSYIQSRVMALGVSARILGIPGSDSDDPVKMLGALVAETPANVAAQDASPGWPRLRSRSASQRNEIRDELLAVASARQGLGRARALNVAVLLPAVKRFVDSFDLGSSNPDDTSMTRYWRTLTEGLRIDLPVERNRLTALLQEIRTYLLPDAVARDLGDKLIRAGEAAATVGAFSPAEELEAFRKDCLQFKTMALSQIGAMETVLALDWENELGSVLAGLARLDREKLGRLVEFLRTAARRLDQTTRRLESRLRSAESGTALGDEVTRLLADLAGQLGPLDSTV